MLPSNRRCARVSRVVVAGLAVLVVAACSDPPRACTEIGATSGLSVRVAGFPRALDGTSMAGPDLVTVQVCVASTCTSSTFNGGEADTAMVEAAFTSTDPVELSVAVSTTSGVLLPVTPFTVTPRKVQPNGPGCDPTAYQAEVAVGRNIPVTPDATPS